MIPQWLFLVPVAIALGAVFTISPASNLLNVVTVPLGYQWQSCPHCPAVSIRRVRWAECENCGERHRTNFGSARWDDGERIPYCGLDCLQETRE
jgi:hypothetical protein